MRKKNEDNAINKIIRERIKQARKDAGETQGELAKILDRSNVAISDIESGKTAVNAALLVQIAIHYKKSISYFYPDVVTIKLSRIEEELLQLFQQLPALEQYAEIDHLRDKIKKQKGKKK
ncbi:MAG: helix-turn-helix domain-containing protein [Chloroflexi bacterium]|nr:helix-turn-helix domain-containing protein [Chloroflexota bacterium]